MKLPEDRKHATIVNIRGIKVVALQLLYGTQRIVLSFYGQDTYYTQQQKLKLEYNLNVEKSNLKRLDRSSAQILGVQYNKGDVLFSLNVQFMMKCINKTKILREILACQIS